MLPYIVGLLGFEPRYMHTPSIQCTALPFAYSPIKVREHSISYVYFNFSCLKEDFSRF